MNVHSVFNKKLEGMCNKYYDYMNFPFTNAVKQTKQVVNADVVMEMYVNMNNIIILLFRMKKMVCH